MGNAAVVYVHGLWMRGSEAALLRWRLRRRYGYDWYTFRYDSVRTPMAQIAAALGERIGRIDAPRVHLLGHSLGGLVILRCLERYRPPQPGRALFLGTPAAGSRAARRLGRWRLGRRLLGRAIAEELLVDRERRWPSSAGRALGIIAGPLPRGLGRLLLEFGETNDGTVAVAETSLEGAAQSCRLAVSHMGMLYSARVAHQTGSFLEHGRFGL